MRTCLKCGSTEFGQFCAVCGGIEFNEAPGAAATVLAAPAPPRQPPTPAPRYQPTPQFQPTPARPPDWYPTPQGAAQQFVPNKPPSSSGGALRAVLIATAVVALLAAIVFVVVRYLEPGRQGLVANPSTSAVETTEAAVPPEQPSTEAPPATVVTVTQTAPDPPPPTIDRDAAAQQELDRMVNESAGRVPLNGQWVAMLAGKWVGITDPLQTTSSGSHTFGAADILEEHQAIKSRVSGVEVVLLDSRTFGDRVSHDGYPLYVTIGLGSFGSREAVLSWCASQFPEYSGQELENRCTSARLTS